MGGASGGCGCWWGCAAGGGGSGSRGVGRRVGRRWRRRGGQSPGAFRACARPAFPRGGGEGKQGGAEQLTLAPGQAVGCAAAARGGQRVTHGSKRCSTQTAQRDTAQGKWHTRYGVPAKHSYMRYAILRLALIAFLCRCPTDLLTGARLATSALLLPRPHCGAGPEGAQAEAEPRANRGAEGAAAGCTDPRVVGWAWAAACCGPGATWPGSCSQSLWACDKRVQKRHPLTQTVAIFSGTSATFHMQRYA